MQKLLLIALCLVAASAADAQSLKEALYGGKLKMDSNAVLRKTDDIKARIDTAQKKPAEPVKAAVATASADSVKGTAPVNTTAVTSTVPETVMVDTATVAAATAPATAIPAKSNTKLWKEYTDSLATVLKAEVLNNKKIKKETYYITLGYELDVDGKVTFTNVAATPANNMIEDGVKQRMDINPLQLAPMLDSNGQPRKVKRSYNFSVTKD